MSNNIRDLINTIIAYLKLIRLHRIITNSSIPVMVVYIFRGWPGLVEHGQELFQFILIVGFFVYGGIYTLNGWADIESDGKDPNRKNRPLPSGAIKKNTGLWIALVHTGLGFTLLTIFAQHFLVYALLFLSINALYTFFLKKFSLISAIIMIPSTMVIRILVGLDIINLWNAQILGLLILFYLALVGVYIKGYQTNEYLKKGRYSLVGKFLLVGGILVGLIGYLQTDNKLFAVIVIATVSVHILWTKLGMRFLKY